jgi:hypothetical protein
LFRKCVVERDQFDDILLRDMVVEGIFHSAGQERRKPYCVLVSGVWCRQNPGTELCIRPNGGAAAAI